MSKQKNTLPAKFAARLVEFYEACPEPVQQFMTGRAPADLLPQYAEKAAIHFKAVAPAAPGVVWEAYGDRDMALLGYVVTERGNPERLIAYSPFAGADPAQHAADHAMCLEDCQRVAEDPRIAGDLDHVNDLRNTGKIDSTNAVPPVVYEWILAPLGSGSHDVDGAQSINPFCRFRIAKLLGFP